MKKYIIGGVLVVAVVAYIIFANRNPAPVVAGPNLPTSTTTTPPTTTGGNAGGTGSGSGIGTGTTGSGTTPTPAPTPVGQYKDGTYTSATADAFYGAFQITVTIAGGKITDVTFPQAPSGGHSSEVSNFALPQLRQEAIAAQSANVNIVSGATQDSQAFQQLLGAVLANAKA